MKHFTDSLFEDIGDYLPEYDIMDIVEKTIKEISKLHPDWAPDYSLLQISVAGYDSTHCLGNTRLYGEGADDLKISISLSKYLLKQGLEDLLVNTFAHEYGHYLVLKQMLTDNRVKFEHGDIIYEKPELEYYYRDDEGHSPCWYEYVDKLSTDLHLKYKITAHPQDAENELYEKINEPEIVATIYCPSNDIPPIKFYEKDPEAFLEKDPQNLKAVVGAFRGSLACKLCDSTLLIKFASEEYEDLYRDKCQSILRMFMLQSFLKQFMR